MTEEEWLDSADPQDMLEYVRRRSSSRKLRLFAVACCRRITHLLPDNPCYQEAVLVAERYADRGARKKELTAAHERARDAKSRENRKIGYRPTMPPCGPTARGSAEAVVLYASELPNGTYAFRAAAMAVTAAIYSVFPPSMPFVDACKPRQRRTNRAAWRKEQRAQVRLLLDLFGNPFRPINVNAGWLTPAVGSLAHAAYEERILPSGEFDRKRLAVLADALEDAGCGNAVILDHLRCQGPHVRGCWAVDRILEKS
jgi:hypothetical protein